MNLTPDVDASQRRMTPETIAKLELIWQMGSASLSETDNELRIPPVVSDGLTGNEIAFLELRLSRYLNNVPTISFKDLEMNIFRVLRMPEMQKTASSPAASVSSTVSQSSLSSTHVTSKVSAKEKRPFGKKARVPRPPNAFILYRQKHHPLVKAENPDIHNNDISVILGQQWKNETPEIKSKFQILAEELKRQHLLKFPDYQYAPRKPSEKKRRMTARKLAMMQKTKADQDTSDFPTAAALDKNGMDSGSFNNEYGSPNNRTQAGSQDYPFTEDLLGLVPNDDTPASNPFTGVDSMNFTDTDPDCANLFHSIIDWSSAEVISPESDQVDQMQDDHPHFNSMSKDEVDAFDSELERTLRLIG